ncbi:N-acetylglucosamine repressor [Peptococcaceae bacterium CEB3]|nr:N-acetylglucosamine repressor [Peptococcaceae bacterium CEB3]
MRLILNLIRMRETVTRIELADLTGLSTATVSNQTNALLGMELIREVGPGEGAAVGRKPILLELKEDARFALGVDVGRTGLTGIITDLKGQAKVRKRIEKKVFLGEDDLLATVEGLVESLIREARVERKKIVGLGIVAPGPLVRWEAEKDILSAGMGDKSFRYKAPFDWSEIPLAKTMEERTGLRVFVDNDANGAALAERWFGGAKDCDNFVNVIVGSGVGAGVLIQGQLYRGEDGLAAELGHTTVNVDGPHCQCGNYGCLELYVSNDAVLDYARARLAENGANSSSLRPALESGKLSVYGIFESAAQEDPIACEVVERSLKYLGSGMVNIVNFFDPNFIFLSTREMPVPDMNRMIRPIQKMIEERAFSVAARRVRLIASSLGEDGPLLGAVTLVLNYFFTSSDNLDVSEGEKQSAQGRISG